MHYPPSARQRVAGALIALSACLGIQPLASAQPGTVLQAPSTTEKSHAMPSFVQSLKARWRSLTGNDGKKPSLTSSGKAATSPATISALWHQYETWLSAHFPEGLRGLAAGASEQELVNLQAALGTQLPSAFLEWARVHNGQADDAVGLLDGNLQLSTDSIQEQWAAMHALLEQGHFQQRGESDPPGAIGPVWWSPHWIPIASDGSGNLVCIDMAPGPSGTQGQVIDFDHETVHRTVLAPSFEAYVRDFVGDVLAGRYGYSEEHGRLMPLNEF